MRLIDADSIKFKPYYDEYVDYDGYINDLKTWQLDDVLSDRVDNTPTVNAIPIELYEQVKGERDVAIEQLKALNIELFEKPYLKAIPIEWIKKYYTDITAPHTDTRIQFEEMIRKWEKENEKSSNRD